MQDARVFKAEFVDEVSRTALLRQTFAKEDALFRGPRGNIAPFRIQSDSLPLTLISAKPTQHIPSSVSSIEKSMKDYQRNQSHDKYLFMVKAQQVVNDTELKPIQRYVHPRTEAQELGWLLTSRRAQRLQRSQQKWSQGRAQCEETKFAGHVKAGRGK
uniref:Uncharacterized protein n=1 Tax=Rhizochromulina marina TaxID=1034831 RepID=A0A7S2SU13_9STRA|mmetsp:Transcript_5961/g.17427  ORF Transcript_5961/g.17427 Transcript_5961/m.17427 type:complete len:158 (+) Transcript_5961:117-590(+)